MRFIWQGKKPRIKIKVMQYAKQRGGFGLPDWVLYYRACILDWIKEWITLENDRLLILEGHDLQLGWHAYLWYKKDKEQKNFNSHMIRKALHNKCITKYLYGCHR